MAWRRILNIGHEEDGGPGRGIIYLRSIAEGGGGEVRGLKRGMLHHGSHSTLIYDMLSICMNGLGLGARERGGWGLEIGFLGVKAAYSSQEVWSL